MPEQKEVEATASPITPRRQARAVQKVLAIITLLEGGTEEVSIDVSVSNKELLSP